MKKALLVLLVIIVAASVLLLGACSSSTPAPSSAPAPAPSTSAAAPATSAASPSPSAKPTQTAAPSPSPAGQVIEWKMPTHHPATVQDFTVLLPKFADMIKQATNGKLVLTLFPSGSIVPNPNDLMNATRDGIVPISISAPSYIRGTIPLTDVLDNLPVSYQSHQEFATIMYNRGLLDLAKPIYQNYGVKLLTVYPTNATGGGIVSKKPINTLADMKGMKIRAYGPYLQLLNNLGAATTNMALTEVYMAASTGTIDGVLTAWEPALTLKLPEVLKYAMMPDVYSTVGVQMVVNPKAWDGLTPGQRTLITNLAMQAQKRMVDQTASVDSLEGAKKLLEPRGMKINAVDAAAFRKIAEEKVWPQYQKQYGQLWDKVVAVK